MAEANNVEERRVNLRFAIPNASMQFRKSIGGPPKRFVCPLINIGRGGAVFVSAADLQPDERMVVTLNLPRKSNYLKLVCHCRWSRRIDGEDSYQVAVAFGRYGASTAKRLAQLEMQYGFLAVPSEDDAGDASSELALAALAGRAVAQESADLAEAAAQPREVPPEFVDVLERFQAFELDIESAKDVLDVLAKGGDFDALARRQEDDERSEMLRTLVPVHEMGESLPAAFDTLGVPIGEPVAYVFLPNTTATATFALQVSRAASLSPGPPRFAKRDLLLFSSEPARDLDHAFVVAGSQGWFGQVFFDQEGEVRVRPPNEDHRECRFRRQDVTAIWRMSAKVEHY